MADVCICCEVFFHFFIHYTSYIPLLSNLLLLWSILYISFVIFTIFFSHFIHTYIFVHVYWDYLYFVLNILRPWFTLCMWVKVFWIVPEFSILRLTFYRKSASKYWIRQILMASLIYTYDNFLLIQYFGQRHLSRKNIYFSINYIVSVPSFCICTSHQHLLRRDKQIQNGGTETM